MPFTQQIMACFYGYLSHLVTVQKTNLSPSLWSVEFSGPVLDITTAISYKSVHEAWQILLYDFELLFSSKTFQTVQDHMEKIFQTKLASSKATVDIYWNKACKDTIRLTGHSVLSTDTFHVTQKLDPNKAAWRSLCKEQQLRHCRQRTRSSQAEWGRTASPTSAHCRQPDQGYCQEHFHKRTW